MKRGLVLTGAVVAVCVLLLALAWRLAVPVSVLAQEPGEPGPPPPSLLAQSAARSTTRACSRKRASQ